jgi:hypothetical protein
MDVAATIEGLRRYLIHGQPYVQVYYAHRDDPETIRQTQMSADALPEGLRVGDTVRVFYVLDVVAQIRRDDEAPGAPATRSTE